MVKNSLLFVVLWLYCNYKMMEGNKMRINVVSIGNSKGIRIPAILLKQCHIGKYVDLKIENKNIILKPIEDEARKGWNEKFLSMKKNNEDKLLINDSLDLDLGDWEW